MPTSPWREPRTLLLGSVVIVAALVEGAATDWLPTFVQALHPHLNGGVFLALFLATSTCIRFLSPPLIERFGRAALFLASVALISAGALGLSFAAPEAQPAWVALCVIAWGMGAALGFPMAMSAAADDLVRAASRVSVVATLGYSAFLAGPPAVGYAIDHLGYQSTLTLIAVIPLLGMVGSTSLRPAYRTMRTGRWRTQSRSQ